MVIFGKGKRDNNDFLSCFYSVLQGLPAENGKGAVPHGDAAGRDALNGTSVEAVHSGGQGSCSSQVLQKVDSPLNFFNQRCSVERSWNMCTSKTWRCSSAPVQYY